MKQKRTTVHPGEAFMVCGAAAVAIGAGLLSLPAGLMVGGVLAIALGALALYGSEDEG